LLNSSILIESCLAAIKPRVNSSALSLSTLPVKITLTSMDDHDLRGIVHKIKF
jgi:hypothetical protein